MSEMDTAQEGAQVEPTGQTEPIVGDPQPDSNAWMFALGIPGEGDKPDWFKNDKYKTVEDQARAYPELESKLGAFTGSPNEYDISLSEEIKEQGLEITKDDPLYEEAIKFAQESNMSQDGFDKMMNLYAMSKIADSKVMEEQRTEQLAMLGENAQQRIDNLVAWGNKNLSVDMMQGFQEMAHSAAAVQTMEHLISMTRSAAMNPTDANPTSPTSSEEVRKMQFEKDDHGNRRINTDKEFRARYEKLKNHVWGSEPNKIIIGA